MIEKQPDFRDSLAALMAETRGEPAGHPDPGQWLAYHRGELPPEEEEVLQEHLVACRECGDLLLSTAAFAAEPAAGDPEGRAGSHGFDDLSRAAAWRLLAPHLDDEEARSAIPRWTWALAASLLAALVGLGAWNLEQRQQLTELARPKANARFVYLLAQERAEPEHPILAAGEPLTLVLYPETPEEGAVYRVVIAEVSAPTEHPLETLEGLSPDEDLALTLLLPAGLPPGRYRVDLFGSRGQQRGEVESYFLEVTDDGGAGAPATP